MLYLPLKVKIFLHLTDISGRRHALDAVHQQSITGLVPEVAQNFAWEISFFDAGMIEPLDDGGDITACSFGRSDCPGSGSTPGLSILFLARRCHRSLRSTLPSIREHPSRIPQRCLKRGNPATTDNSYIPTFRAITASGMSLIPQHTVPIRPSANHGNQPPPHAADERWGILQTT
ncbi:hypothetical protein EX30DRAFT_377034 [Ascodesmis nigricans]|uniref:Uncharacterized protein n=1 Tax=Ascodesmis nigricans TaxID=341454 RepID=A0A4S2N838_9PEZI|nr:hypothetical protein EX30DRAFT_377034 [Ascodesmis nigricans]